MQLLLRHALLLAAVVAAIVVGAGTGIPVRAQAVGAERDEAPATLYIVGLRDAPLATYTGGVVGLAPAARLPNGRLDVAGPAATAYVEHLEQQQNAFLQRASAALGRALAPSDPRFQFQHAFNGMVLTLTGAEADALRRNPQVALVEPLRLLQTTSDTGPELLGAPSLWDGSNAPPGRNSRGEGIVIGVLDSGVNLGNAAFAEVSPSDGYTHTNPLGAGNFLGWCNPTHPNHTPGRDVCNAKLIGGWDFVDDVLVPGSPIFASGAIEARGFEDENGHGSHTASTAAGNRRNVVFNGIPVTTSGVAPRANLVIYDVCYTPPSGLGTCPNVSLLAAVNQVVADGVVDVVNYSIGGGTQPWTEAISLAFLNATAAGVLISASAGNGGPTPASLGHQTPWVMTVGASTLERVFGFDFTLTAPGTPPPVGQGLVLRAGAAPLPTGLTNAPLIVSPGFANGANDGCAAYPANTFRRPTTAAGTPGIAVIRFSNLTSTCPSGTRRNNAVNAGAAGFLFVTDFPLGLGASGNTLQMTVVQWQPIANYLATEDPTGVLATASIGNTLLRGPNPADAMAGFSSRGPSAFDALKPDVVAPGLEVFDALSRWVSSPAPGVLNPALNQNHGLLSGTSMAAPHNAGAAALVKALNRSWTPTQIKTALVTTATPAVLREDTVTATTPFDRGAGRVDLNLAARAGLLMDESAANFSAANPALGGNPATLNLPSFQAGACVGICTFPRRVRGTRATSVTWTASFNGLPAGSASLPSFTTTSAAETPITLSIDATLLPQGQYSFGEVVLTPSDPTIPTARMAIAVRPGAPDIDVTPTALSASVVQGQSTSRTLTVRNTGNPTINWAWDASGSVTVPLLTQAFDQVWGNSVNFYSGQVPPGGIFAAEDLSPTTPGPAILRSIRGEGFMTGGTVATTLPQTATSIVFKLYADAAGVPAAHPQTSPLPPGAELYTCTRTPTGATSAGLGFGSVGTSYVLDTLAAASAATSPCMAPPALVPGTTYWVSAYPVVPGTSGSRRMALGRATAVIGRPGQWISPTGIGGVPTSWTTVPLASSPGFPDGLQAFAYQVAGDVRCGAPWMSATPLSGALGASASQAVTVTFDASALAPGTYRATACISSEGTDADEPKIAVPVTLTVTPAPSPPSVVGAADPSPVAIGSQTLLTATVTPGANPASTGLVVRSNLAAIGGSPLQVLVDDGTNGDQTAGDNVFSFRATIGAGTTPGALALPLTVSDAQARSGTGTIALEIKTPIAPSLSNPLATPAVVELTGTTTLSVEVTPGADPPSTGLAVTADLRSIGGSATEPLIAGAGGVYRAEATIPTSVAPGARAIPVTVRDAQNRSATTTIALTVATPTAPTGTATVVPPVAGAGDPVVLTVDVTPGATPAGTAHTVRADLGAIGGPSNLLLTPVSGVPNRFSATATVTITTSPGEKTLPVSITETAPLARTASLDATLTVSPPTDPVIGSASATPPTVEVTGSTTLRVTVTPGTAPPSTGITVTGDLTEIGGASTQAFTAGAGNVFTFNATIPLATTPGSKSIPVTVRDAQNRSASGTITLSVATPNAPTLSNGTASPSTVAQTATTRLSIDVTPGTAPPSTGLVVRADLTGIGGPAAQPLAPGSGVSFVLDATVAAGTAPGPKTIPVTVTDAQNRSATANIDVIVATPVPPSLSNGTATPANVSVTETLTLAIDVIPGSLPGSTGVVVTADLGSIGGGSAVPLTPGAGISYGLVTTVAANTVPGPKTIPVTVRDAQGRSASAGIALTVRTPGALGASAGVSPSAILPGGFVLVTLNVTPGVNPTSSAIQAQVDLSQVGGSATQPLFDDGSNGDATAGDGIYSFRHRVPGPVAPGAYALLATVSDQIGRNAAAAASLTVTAPQSPVLFSDGFE